MIASDGARMENIINGETQCYERCSNMIKNHCSSKKPKEIEKQN